MLEFNFLEGAVLEQTEFFKMVTYSHFFCRGSHAEMATKITHYGFDVELGRESESKDCQLLCLSQKITAERAFSLQTGLSTRWNITLKNYYFYNMFFFSPLKILLDS